jgi:glyoxylase-like metal-dependent hydrolase (beta-lactamase superfamily II)
MGIDYELLVFPHPKYALSASRRSGSKVWCRCPAISYVIEHPEGRVLWETGISTNFKVEWPEEWQQLIDMSEITPEVCLEARLRSIGLGPEDFRYVVQGHLHCDHAGGLRLFEQAGADILCHEEEWKFVSQIETADFFYTRPDWNFLSRKRPVTLYGDQEILEDLWLVSLPGHTPGTMGLLVRLEHTGWVILTSDALYTHESYGPPPVGSPIVWNKEQWTRSVEKIRRLASTRNALILPGHDTTAIQHEGERFGLRQIPFDPVAVYE